MTKTISIFNKIKILYEDKDVLVLNKPAGLVVHEDGKTKEHTLVEWLLKKYPNIKKVGEPAKLSDGSEIEKPGIVHRLDRETSGVLIVAKNQKAFLFLKKQFQNHEVVKIYNAFVYGRLTEGRGTIDLPIGRDKKDFRLWSAQRGARGELREAETFYKVLKMGDASSYIEARPKTGRTHQIRVHFRAIQHPVVADSLYAPKHPKILGFKRSALHASSIEFMLPNGDKKKIEASLPTDFKKALKLLK